MPRKGHRNPDTVEKQRRCLDLRRAGVTYDVIAEQVGYSNAGAAYNAVKSALKATLQEPADEIRVLESDRLDRLERALWPAALNGDQGAIDRILRISERRARLLGLDAPLKQHVEVTAYEGGTDIDREVARLADTLRRTRDRSPLPVEDGAGTP